MSDNARVFLFVMLMLGGVIGLSTLIDRYFDRLFDKVMEFFRRGL